MDSLFDTMTQRGAFDGQPARLVKLENSLGMSVTLMDIGATWLSCLVPVNGGPREMILGVSSMLNFQKQTTYLGAIVGRYANRIALGQFVINEERFQLKTNQAGNTLHGGPEGFDKRRWNIEEQTANSVLFSLISEAGDQGFPGQLNVTVHYQLTEKNQVVIRYQAQTDSATPVNLTNHAYFNLDGAESSRDCKDHYLYINAEYYLPIDKVGIPLGELASVTDTSFDFRQRKLIKQDFLVDEQQQSAKGYDHAYLLNDDCKKGACAAQVYSADKQVMLKVFTDKPAIQLYTGNWLAGTPNRSGGEYQDYAGLALETQFLPDSPNHSEWPQPSSVLAPEDEYNYQTIYEFTVQR
jgi:aldose 1-epimerase